MAKHNPHSAGYSRGVPRGEEPGERTPGAAFPYSTHPLLRRGAEREGFPGLWPTLLLLWWRILPSPGCVSFESTRHTINFHSSLSLSTHWEFLKFSGKKKNNTTPYPTHKELLTNHSTFQEGLFPREQGVSKRLSGSQSRV